MEQRTVLLSIFALILLANAFVFGMWFGMAECRAGLSNADVERPLPILVDGEQK